jgi:hypothetical protein
MYYFLPDRKNSTQRRKDAKKGVLWVYPLKIHAGWFYAQKGFLCVFAPLR